MNQKIVEDRRKQEMKKTIRVMFERFWLWNIRDGGAVTNEQ